MSNNKPSHLVYTIQDGDENRPDFWTKIGAAFAHNDGKGYSLLLNALPTNGRLTIRVHEPKNADK